MQFPGMTRGTSFRGAFLSPSVQASFHQKPVCGCSGPRLHSFGTRWSGFRLVCWFVCCNFVNARFHIARESILRPDFVLRRMKPINLLQASQRGISERFRGISGFASQRVINLGKKRQRKSWDRSLMAQAVRNEIFLFQEKAPQEQ